jgi:hypothetical protein
VFGDWLNYLFDVAMAKKIIFCLLALGLGFWLNAMVVRASETQIEVTINNNNVPIDSSPTPTPMPSPTPQPTPAPSNPGQDNNPSTSTPGVPGSPSAPPPFIYRADRLDDTTIKLFFNVGGRPFTHYLLVYGYAGHEFAFGARIDNPDDAFVIVGGLFVNVKYDFQIIPVNDYIPGERSNIFPVTLNNRRISGGEKVALPVTIVTATKAAEKNDDEIVMPVVSPVAALTTATTEEVATGLTCEANYGEKIIFYRGFLPTKCGCKFEQTWLWWLCFPYWLIVLLLVIFVVGYVVYWRRRERKK